MHKHKLCMHAYLNLFHSDILCRVWVSAKRLAGSVVTRFTKVPQLSLKSDLQLQNEPLKGRGRGRGLRE